MANPQTTDFSEAIGDAATDFFFQLWSFVEITFRRFFGNLYTSFVDVSARRWTKVAVVVLVYVVLRPYLEKFFKWLHDRDRRKEKEKKEADKAARTGAGTKKPKMSANALRGGSGSGGKVLGEVDNTDDELEDEDEDNLAKASGVPEWNNMARKRQKKYLKNLQKEAGKRADDLSEEQIMELLDWSESEGEKK
ncbi:hypothetical protein NUU61_004580 [Penicillium alfredii]|uniref:Protein trafficking Pga2 n=1 Tax=Penicillium alfredii TaxID=1506179 RepID=A0A9W9KE32_9EURO|nr:uncharacterized protein NUU61_004580 [Penicillium alfredii]KAJ5102358.1 hypothetical protein NUU61_004580 [Penicillium alfredii]